MEGKYNKCLLEGRIAKRQNQKRGRNGYIRNQVSVCGNEKVSIVNNQQIGKAACKLQVKRVERGSLENTGGAGPGG